MRPAPWHPPIEWSAAERSIAQRVRRAKLFPFLRSIRHELFDDAFQEELAALYKDSPLGQPPVPPAKLALTTILQAYTGASDDEALEALLMDRRWQLVSIVSTPRPPRLAKGRWYAADRRSAPRRSIGDSSNGPWPWRSETAVWLPVRSGWPWTPVRFGAPAEWKTRTTFWAMLSERP